MVQVVDFFLMEDKVNLDSEGYPDDARNQSISGHGIDLIRPEYCGLCSSRAPRYYWISLAILKRENAIEAFCS